MLKLIAQEPPRTADDDDTLNPNINRHLLLVVLWDDDDA